MNPLIEALREEIDGYVHNVLGFHATSPELADDIIKIIDSRIGKALAAAEMREQYAEFISGNTEIWSFEQDQAAIAAYDAAVRDGQGK